MTAPRPLLIDLDGTLVDSTDAILDGVLALAAEVGLPTPDREWLLSRIGHEPRDTWAALGSPDPQAMVDLFTERILPGLSAHTRVLPGVAEALDRLIAAGHPIAVATTRLTENARDALRATGLEDRVQHVTGRDLVPRAKPAPDILLHALDAIGGDVGDALMIGDSVADVLAAHAAGITCWAVLGGTGTEKSLRDAGPARILTGGMGDVPDLLRAPPAVRP